MGYYVGHTMYNVQSFILLLTDFTGYVDSSLLLLCVI